MISVLFTPIVGALLAGINHRRLGFPKKAKREYAISLLTLLGYSLLFSFVVGLIPRLPLTFFLPPVIILKIAIRAPVPFLVLFALPSALIILGIYVRQKASWNASPHTKYGHETWWQAYTLAGLLMPVTGILLIATAQFFLILRAYL